jgi:hypothetical protein
VLIRLQAEDVVSSIDFYDLNPILIFTAIVGIVMFSMSWIILVISIKERAARKGHEVQG